MKIAKYLHSCLLFEQDGGKLLFDPGTHSFVEGLVTPDTFRDVSTVVITHGHPDHLDLENLKQILALSGADVITNGEVAETLSKEGIDATVVEEGAHTADPFRLLAIPTPHEPILAQSTPRHTAYLVNDRVLNCADSFGAPLLAHAGVEILIMPVMAPFLTEVGAFAFAKQMRPRQVIPVHDGYSKPFFLKLRYDNYEKHFEGIGARFHRLSEPGDSVEV
jgi:L-ascorbate metabolism protein UlaG (beta-lactamase superfamily)